MNPTQVREAWLRCKPESVGQPNLEEIRLDANEAQLTVWLLQLVLCDRRQFKVPQLQVDLLIAQLQQRLHSDRWFQQLEAGGYHALLYLLRWHNVKPPSVLPVEQTFAKQLGGDADCDRLEHLEKFFAVTSNAAWLVESKRQRTRAEEAIRASMVEEPIYQQMLSGGYACSLDKLCKWWPRSPYDWHVHFLQAHQLEMAYLVYLYYKPHGVRALMSWQMWLINRLETLCQAEAERLNLLPCQVAAWYLPCYALLWLVARVHQVPRHQDTIRRLGWPFDLFYEKFR